MKTAIYLLLPFMLLLTGCIYGEEDAMDSYHGSGDPLFVALYVSATSRAVFSRDGITWHQGGETGAEINTITYGNGYFVAGGNGSRISKSRDGITWNEYVAEGLVPPEQFNFLLVLYHDGVYIANAQKQSDSTYYFLYSYDALHWNISSSDCKGELNKLGYGNGIYFGCGDFDELERISLYTSKDGIIWEDHYMGDKLYDVVFGNTLFVSTGTNHSNTVGSIFSSHSPAAWSQNLLDPYSHPMNGIAYGNRRFVALSENAEVFISETGFDWSEPCTLPSSVELIGEKIIFGAGRFIVICKDTSISELNHIFYSEDGYKWSTSSVPAGINSISDLTFRP